MENIFQIFTVFSVGSNLKSFRQVIFFWGCNESNCDNLRRMNDSSERLRLRPSEEGLFILRSSFVTPPNSEWREDRKMLTEFKLPTSREDFFNITAQVREAISKSGVKDGIAVVYCPHTTAGITINEYADKDVVHDILLGLAKAFPDHWEFRHGEGNSAAHIKASAIGSSVTIIVADGRPVLGTWQGVFFAEFDPPRNRTFFVKVI